MSKSPALTAPDAARAVRLAFVIPWRDRGGWVWEYLRDQHYCGDLLFAAPEPGAFLDRRRWLPPYIAELVHLAARRPHLDAYDVLFAWELRTALAVAVLRRFQSASRRAAFVPVGPILKGPANRALPLVRWLLRDADRIVCFSRAECETQARLLSLPAERFLFVPTPWRADEPVAQEDGRYILALGHSGRDYPLLLDAVRGTDLPVVIVARSPSDLGAGTVPQNVTVRYNTGHHETNALIAGATFHVIPLQDTDYSAGQTVLLRAMARGKAVVVTSTVGVRDYVRDGETAVLVPPGNVEALRTALQGLWNDAQTQGRIGRAAVEAAKETSGFPQFARHLVEIAEGLLTDAKGAT